MLENVTLLFSKKATETYPAKRCDVPDGSGGTKRVAYTAIYGDDHSNYGWPDKEIVWTGPEDQMTNIVIPPMSSLEKREARLDEFPGFHPS
jgi:hypothetical protein